MRINLPFYIAYDSCVLSMGTINPFASIARTGMSKGKVKVRDICLNISFLT